MNNFRIDIIDMVDILKWCKDHQELQLSWEKLIANTRKTSFSVADMIKENLTTMYDKKTLHNNKTLQRTRLDTVKLEPYEAEILIAYFPDKVIGTMRISLMLDKQDSWWIDSVIVDPSNRKMGMCQQMFRYLTNKYPNRVYRLGVKADNKDAIKCYDRSGFYILDEIIEYGEKGYLMGIN
jgi:ribosomal protein S18 acetylase RimI-like enzyme